MDTKTITEWLGTIAIIVFVVALGTFAVNQVMQFYYNSQLLQQPCGLCLQLNPNLTLSPKVANIIGSPNNFSWKMP